MSHSKITKRGRSHYIESWNSRAKNYIVTRKLCGHRGYSPTILNDEFSKSLENKAIRSELKSTLDPLELNEWGHCSICASRLASTNEKD